MMSCKESLREREESRIERKRLSVGQIISDSVKQTFQIDLVRKEVLGNKERTGRRIPGFDGLETLLVWDKS